MSWGHWTDARTDGRTDGVQRLLQLLYVDDGRIIIFLQFVLGGGRSVFLKSAIDQSYLPIMTSDCPESNGEQAIATLGRQ